MSSEESVTDEMVEAGAKGLARFDEDMWDVPWSNLDPKYQAELKEMAREVLVEASFVRASSSTPTRTRNEK